MSDENKVNENGSKFDKFLLGFLIMVIPYVGLFFGYKMSSGYGIISAFFLALLFMVIGTILWAIIKLGFHKRMLGLGFLTGGLAPLLLMFIFTGGCGMFI